MLTVGRQEQSLTAYSQPTVLVAESARRNDVHNISGLKKGRNHYVKVENREMEMEDGTAGGEVLKKER